MHALHGTMIKVCWKNYCHTTSYVLPSNNYSENIQCKRLDLNSLYEALNLSKLFTTRNLIRAACTSIVFFLINIFKDFNNFFYMLISRFEFGILTEIYKIKINFLELIHEIYMFGFQFKISMEIGDHFFFRVNSRNIFIKKLNDVAIYNSRNIYFQ
jgi:hypothetical protein